MVAALNMLINVLANMCSFPFWYRNYHSQSRSVNSALLNTYGLLQINRKRILSYPVVLYHLIWLRGQDLNL